MIQQPPEREPIIVRIIEPPGGELGALGDVLVGALGLAGAITVLAVLAGIVVGALLFWIRSRRSG